MRGRRTGRPLGAGPLHRLQAPGRAGRARPGPARPGRRVAASRHGSGCTGPSAGPGGPGWPAGSGCRGWPDDWARSGPGLSLSHPPLPRIRRSRRRRRPGRSTAGSGATRGGRGDAARSSCSPACWAPMSSTKRRAATGSVAAGATMGGTSRAQVREARPSTAPSRHPDIPTIVALRPSERVFPGRWVSPCSLSSRLDDRGCVTHIRLGGCSYGLSSGGNRDPSFGGASGTRVR